MSEGAPRPRTWQKKPPKELWAIAHVHKRRSAQSTERNLTSMALITDSNRPQPLWRTPPTACLTASGAASDAPSLLMHPWLTQVVAGSDGTRVMCVASSPEGCSRGLQDCRYLSVTTQ